MLERGISRGAVKGVLESGALVEDYPDDAPYPSALMLGFSDGEPLHVVAAYDQGSRYCLVVTVYRPDARHFEDDYRTRKR
jgi:hypothetical protein